MKWALWLGTELAAVSEAASGMRFDTVSSLRSLGGMANRVSVHENGM